MLRKKSSYLILMFFLLVVNAGWAALPIHLENLNTAYFSRFFIKEKNKESFDLRIINSEKDFNHIYHTRVQQFFNSIPVWDGTAVIHTSEKNNEKGSFILLNLHQVVHGNGMIYEDLKQDLNPLPNEIFTHEKQIQALQIGKKIFNEIDLTKNYQREEVQQIIFIDHNNNAHYAYLVSFYFDDGKTGAHYPAMILDAVSFHLYKKWDRVFTVAASTIVNTAVGGIGGNEKIGEIIYGGGSQPLQTITMHREIENEINNQEGICYFENANIKVEDVAYDNVVVAAECLLENGKHNNVAWIDQDNNFSRWKDDEMNGGFSPSLDAFYAGTVISKMYEDWFHIPPLIEKDGKTPMLLILRTHYGRSFENAFWDGRQMTFGDGGKAFYPLTSLDVAAHEISHGFTEQHSNLDITANQMAALHESFSDMASAAVDFYVNNKNSWMIGKNITKGEGAIRYLDYPTKDGESIDNFKDYSEDLDPHLAAGIFNKAFYLISTLPNWDTHKAFNVMVKANQHYWTSSMSTFNEAACGVLSATKDYQYDVGDVRVAFSQVGIDTTHCAI